MKKRMFLPAVLLAVCLLAGLSDGAEETCVTGYDDALRLAGITQEIYAAMPAEQQTLYSSMRLREDRTQTEMVSCPDTSALSWLRCYWSCLLAALCYKPKTERWFEQMQQIEWSEGMSITVYPNTEGAVKAEDILLQKRLVETLKTLTYEGRNNDILGGLSPADEPYYEILLTAREPEIAHFGFVLVENRPEFYLRTQYSNEVGADLGNTGPLLDLVREICVASKS